jgi:hypothetical protein
MEKLRMSGGSTNPDAGRCLTDIPEFRKAFQTYKGRVAGIPSGADLYEEIRATGVDESTRFCIQI